MKIALLSALASACAAPALVAAHHDAPNGVIYVFDADYAGGVDGTIRADWNDGTSSNRVTLTADLRFKRVDPKLLLAADGNCTGPVKEYTYHIHTLWNQPKGYQSSSASYAQCAKSITGNHYDPNKACGPASEYAGTPDCAAKVKNYKCNPHCYAMDPATCEVGDLSGKLGTLKPNKDGVVKAKWTDSQYPAWDKHQPTWNIVIHAVCGSATPRVACSVGSKLGPKKKLLKGYKHHHHDYQGDEGGDDGMGGDSDDDMGGDSDDMGGDNDEGGDDEQGGDSDEGGDNDESGDDEQGGDNDEGGDEGYDESDTNDDSPFGGIPHKKKGKTIVVKIYTEGDK